MKYTTEQQVIGDFLAEEMAITVKDPDAVGYVCEPFHGMIELVSVFTGRPKTKRLFRDVRKALEYIRSGKCRWEMTDGYNTQ